ncbi:MAG: gluconokinase [Burkholderiaceae bacterium]
MLTTQNRQSRAGTQRWVVMGVSGSGKSEIGRRLAHQLGCAFVEGDDFHPAANIAKMGAGVALTDEDRWEWLQVLAHRLAFARENKAGLVLSCSALKRAYRDVFRGGDPAVRFVHLHGSPAALVARMQRRTGHFMPASLLDSQLRDLQPLGLDEGGITLDIAAPPEELVARILRAPVSGAIPS